MQNVKVEKVMDLNTRAHLYLVIDGRKFEYATYPWKEIASIRIRIERFIAFHGCCDLSYNIFPNSIINGYWANLKFIITFSIKQEGQK